MEGEDVHFHTRSGLLVARKEGARIVLDFPATPATAAPAPMGLLSALGLKNGNVFFNTVDYLVQVEDEERAPPLASGLYERWRRSRRGA